MIVRVIKQYSKHNIVHEVGEEFGVTKESALHLINRGFAEDLDDVLKLKKKVVKSAPKKSVKKQPKKKK